MAGRARTHAITEELARRVTETFDPDPEDTLQPTALDYVCHRIESTKTAKALAQELETTLGFPFDYAMLMRYLRAQFGAETAEQRVDEARVRASHCLAEDAMEIVDGPAETQFDVSRASSRARARQWMAERYNPSKYGQSKGVSVSVTVGSLHLDALKHVNAIVAAQVTGSAQPLLQSGSHNNAPTAEHAGQVIAVHGVAESG